MRVRQRCPCLLPVLAPLGPQTESNRLQHGGVIAGANFVIARSINDIQPTALELLSTERQEATTASAELSCPICVSRRE